MNFLKVLHITSFGSMTLPILFLTRLMWILSVSEAVRVQNIRRSNMHVSTPFVCHLPPWNTTVGEPRENNAPLSLYPLHQGFLTSALLTWEPGNSLLEDCPVHCRLFHSNPCTSQLGISSTHPIVMTKYVTM